MLRLTKARLVSNVPSEDRNLVASAIADWLGNVDRPALRVSSSSVDGALRYGVQLGAWVVGDERTEPAASALMVAIESPIKEPPLEAAGTLVRRTRRAMREAERWLAARLEDQDGLRALVMANHCDSCPGPKLRGQKS